jgi:hypothetical protein
MPADGVEALSTLKTIFEDVDGIALLPADTETDDESGGAPESLTPSARPLRHALRNGDFCQTRGFAMTNCHLARGMRTPTSEIFFRQMIHRFQRCLLRRGLAHSSLREQSGITQTQAQR